MSGLLWLQRAAGNAAASALLADHRAAAAVQRQPERPGRGPHTLTWETEDSSQEHAKLHRTTKIEADAWGEVGPALPRIKFNRRVSLKTPSGADVFLRLNVTVYLQPNGQLPASAQEALRTPGRAVSGGWSLNAEGGDLEPGSEDRFYRDRATVSMLALTADFPDFATWNLTAGQQEAALLRHLATWKHRPPKDVGSDETADYIKGGADLITDFVPGVSNVKDFAVFLSGENPVTGEKVGWLGRLLALVFAIPGLGSLLKWLGKGAGKLAKQLLGPLLRMAKKAGGQLIRWIGRTRWGGRVATWGSWAWRHFKKRLRSLVGPKILKGAEAANARAAFKTTEKQVQSKFQKHAADFGVAGNWSKKKGAEFEAALTAHVTNPANLVIKGEYNAVPSIIHLDPNSGLAVIQDLGGSFVSGWKLTPKQLQNVLAHGSLGGH